MPATLLQRLPVLLAATITAIAAMVGLASSAGAQPMEFGADRTVHGATLLAAAGRTAESPSAPTETSVTHPAADHLGSTVASHLGSDPAALGRSLGASTTVASGSAYGMDVSSYQGNVDWPAIARNGAAFAYVKATESSGYINPYFGQQYGGSAAAGLVRGAYHFALPNNSGGATQANYFVGHGGGWSGDGRTLPPMLDIEYNPYGSSCYGLSTWQMSAWIRAFSDTVKARTGRYPTIYTTADWWNTCTGGDGNFAGTNPLFIARYASSPGTLPAGWHDHTIWQYADHGQFPGDADVFNGSQALLRQFAAAASATGGPSDPLSVRYHDLGGAGSLLGNPVGKQYKIPGGRGQNYQAGRMYYTPATGVHLVRGLIMVDYLALGGPGLRMGAPITDELTTPDGGGRYNHFSGSGASIYWSPATGAHEVQGAIRSLWASYGWEQGLLGYPTTNELPAADGVGRYNHFSGSGGSIYWSPATGAHEVHGAIRSLWASYGWERGSLGYPISDEYAVVGGRRSDFQHGTVIYTFATGGLQVIYR